MKGFFMSAFIFRFWFFGFLKKEISNIKPDKGRWLQFWRFAFYISPNVEILFLNKFSLFFIAGLIFGIFNEFYFEPMWKYDQVLSPFIWKDVPLIAPIGWGLLTALILCLSDFINFKLFRKSPFFLDVFLFVLVMAPLEYLFSRQGLWTYVSILHKMPLTMVFGYMLAALLISSLARRLHSFFILENQRKDYVDNINTKYLNLLDKGSENEKKA